MHLNLMKYQPETLATGCQDISICVKISYAKLVKLLKLVTPMSE